MGSLVAQPAKFVGNYPWTASCIFGERALWREDLNPAGFQLQIGGRIKFSVGSVHKKKCGHSTVVGSFNARVK